MSLNILTRRFTFKEPNRVNAVAESFFGTLKSEQVQGARYVIHDRTKGDIVDYIEMFYNSKRIHSFFGYMSPMEWEKQWLLQQAA